MNLNTDEGCFSPLHVLHLNKYICHEGRPNSVMSDDGV